MVLTVISPAKDGSADLNSIDRRSARRGPASRTGLGSVRAPGGLALRGSFTFRIHERHPERPALSPVEGMDHASHGTWRKPRDECVPIQEGPVQGLLRGIDDFDTIVLAGSLMSRMIAGPTCDSTLGPML